MEIVSLYENPQYIDVVAEWTWNEFCKIDRPSVTLSDTRAKLAAQDGRSLPHTYIALDGEEAVGTITMYDNNLQGERATPWMGSLFVPNEHRGGGVAKALILHIKERAKREGFDTLYLRTEHASGYYEKLGWSFVKDAIDPLHNLATKVYKMPLCGYRAERLNDKWNSVRLFDDAAGTDATIAVSRGGILTAFYAAGREIMYIKPDTLADAAQNVRGGCPILFPICGRLIDGKYTLNGKTYQMEIHGVARKLPWEIVSCDTQNAAQVTIALSSNEETRAAYPFDFRLEYTYKLKGNTLSIEQKIKNLSSETMPFSSGLHPYFRVNKANAKAIVDGEEISYFSSIDFAKGDVRDFKVTVESGLGHKIAVSAEGAYSAYVFYATEDEPMACAEPWTARPNALNTKEKLICLAPGEVCNLRVSFEVSLDK